MHALQSYSGPGAELIWFSRLSPRLRGPICFPTNYLLIQALYKCHRMLGDTFVRRAPDGSTHERTFEEIALDLSRRLIGIFRRDPVTKKRPVHGEQELFARKEWQDLVRWRFYSPRP